MRCIFINCGQPALWQYESKGKYIDFYYCDVHERKISNKLPISYRPVRIEMVRRIKELRIAKRKNLLYNDIVMAS